jgi:ABC-type transport system substrate-binding protein
MIPTPHSSAPSPSSTILRAGVLGPPSELDPRKAADYVSGLILDQIFETPYLSVVGQSAVQPQLFEPLRGESTNGLVHSAALRPGILFSDGTPLTPELAARSLRLSEALTGKVSVTARGERIWFELSAPNPRFDLMLTHGSCSIVLDKGLQLLGTGPFMFDHRPNLRLMQKEPRTRLILNPHYRGKTRLQELEFHVLPPEADGTPRALVEALRSGAIDVTTALSATDLAVWQIQGVAPITRPSISTGLLFLNTEHRLLKSSAARKGVAAAIDVLDIAAVAYGRNPAAFIATNVLPPAMSRSGSVPRTNPIDAARFIEEAGLRGERLRLLIPWGPRPYLPKPLSIAQSIQKQLGNAGVLVTLIETASPESYFADLTAGRFELALGGWIGDTLDPADYFEALLSSHAIGSASLANCSRGRQRSTDEMLGRFRVEPSDANRRAIEHLIADEVPFLPLIYGQASALHARRVHDVMLTATGSMSLAGVTIT